MTNTTSMTRQQRIVQAVKRSGLGLLVAVAVLGWGLYIGERGQVDDLVTTARRSRPTADYIAAEFAHTDCRKNNEDVFLAAVGAAFDSTLTPEQRRTAQDAAHAASLTLARIEDICPTPSPPVFDKDGKLVKPPVIPTTSTTSTTTVTAPP